MAGDGRAGAPDGHAAFASWAMWLPATAVVLPMYFSVSGQRDLHTLLDRPHVPGPYVLAGQSFGGLYIQSFATLFPEQVAGMVLLDSTAPKPGPLLPTNTESSNVVDRVSALVSAVATSESDG